MPPLLRRPAWALPHERVFTESHFDYLWVWVYNTLTHHAEWRYTANGYFYQNTVFDLTSATANVRAGTWIELPIPIDPDLLMKEGL